MNQLDPDQVDPDKVDADQIYVVAMWTQWKFERKFDSDQLDAHQVNLN